MHDHMQCYRTNKTHLLEDEIDCIYGVFINFQYVLLGNNITDISNFSFPTQKQWILFPNA